MESQPVVNLGLHVKGNIGILSYDGSLGVVDVLLDVVLNEKTHGLFLTLRPERSIKLTFESSLNTFRIDKIRWWKRLKS